MASGEPLRVEVLYCAAPGQVDRCGLDLAAGATVATALEASGIPMRHGLDLSLVKVGVWSRVKPLDTPLRDRDRVEIYRALRVDPKEARRLRYQKQRPPPKPVKAETAPASPAPARPKGSAAV